MDTVDNLILDLLEWMGPRPRPYADVLEAWRTSCPRLPVWEKANDRGFVVRRSAARRRRDIRIDGIAVLNANTRSTRSSSFRSAN